MLKKENRLNKEKDFKKVFKKGKYLEGDFLLFRYLENSLNNSRFGIIISNKTLKKAVKRNLIKRRIREVIRDNLSMLENHFDMVIIVKRSVLGNSDFKTIKKKIEQIFEKINK